jgi:DNA-binding MarR family transcriptional regulator
VAEPTPAEVDQVLRFVLDEIDSVPELEALLLLWQNRPAAWNVADVARRLYIVPQQAQAVLADLSRKGMLAADPERQDSYLYASTSAERDELMARTEAVYRRQIVRISTLIHSKPSSAVRDFARAFRFTKEK